jgi:ABC-type sugar transport system, periplasmic component
MNRSKLVSLGALIAVCSTTLLSACASNNNSAASPSANAGASEERVTLSFYDWTDEQPYMEEVVSGFEAKYPNIKINENYVPSTDYGQKILVNLSTGEEMDVFTISSFSGLAEYSSKQMLEPLDDVAASTDLSGISDIVNTMKDGDHIYGLPYRTSKWVLYYNKDLFDKAGIDYPDGSWTWDKYAEAAKQLTSGSGQSKIYGSLSYPADNTWWRVLANIEGATNPLNPNELETFKKSLSYYYDLTKSGAQQPFGELVGTAGADYTGRFLQGNVGMQWNGDWEVQMLNDAIKDKGVKLNYDIAPLPHWEGSETTTPGALTAVMVSKQSKHKDAAKKFAEYLASEEAAKIISARGLLTPWTTDAVKEAFTSNLTAPENSSLFSEPIKVVPQVPLDPQYNQGINIVKEETSLYLLDKQSLDETFTKIQDRIKKEITP